VPLNVTDGSPFTDGNAGSSSDVGEDEAIMSAFADIMAEELASMKGWLGLETVSKLGRTHSANQLAFQFDISYAAWVIVAVLQDPRPILKKPWRLRTGDAVALNYILLHRRTGRICRNG